MQEKTFEQYLCWKPERVSQVVNKEAVSVDKATFLATHAPFTNLMYQRMPQQITDKSERGLLRELQQCAANDRHAFVVVQGVSGSGKSHLIRWLKDRYQSESEQNQSGEVVLLIERAQNSLRGTLQQIIRSNILQDAGMHKQLERLQDATTKLSKGALADTIIDQLRIAATEVQLPGENLPGPYIRKRLEKFLLDYYVRRDLKKPNGPIDRITRFLSVGKAMGVTEDESLRFTANEFVLGVDTRRAIRDEGYREAKELADKLHDPDEPESRDALARYLNRLLTYAIAHTTALSADDLKQIFSDLRRHLRKQNRQLVLFIEDITAFTGIDIGLVDVLATQHRGEGNQEFCRLLSVIGITDSYYNDSFPDNIKDRVTHHLTLNVEQEGRIKTDLLTNPGSLAALSARYLNAIRLDQETLDNWLRHGAYPERLPNACERCQFRITCHNAFGAVNIASEADTPQLVGLYPFNEQALWTMLQNITIPDHHRTPRLFLNSVLQYVLESHGRKIRSGDFPPPSKEMGSDFGFPALIKPAQRSILDHQGGKDARRIESLVVFWGTRTLDATNTNDHRLIGGLSEDVFKAFGVPFIEGDTASSSILSPVANPTSYSSVSTRSLPSSYAFSSHNTVLVPSPIPSASINGVSTPSPLIKEVRPIEAQVNKYAEDINNWLNGEKLRNYEKLGGMLVNTIKTFIDWELYDINSIQVENRINRWHIAIEGQVGKINADSMIFARSPKLVDVLNALAALDESDRQLAPATLGAYFTLLSNWLYEQEPHIVDFVRCPTNQATASISLVKTLVLDCVLLACLQGELVATAYSPQDILFLIVQGCKKTDASSWQNHINTAQTAHSKFWIDLMKGVNSKEYVYFCRQSLLKALNMAQGDSSDIRFIDAATVLDVLNEFDKNAWNLAPTESVGSSAAPAWIAATEVYNNLQKNFAKALEADCQQIEEYLSRLAQLTESEKSTKVFEAISEWVKRMKQYKKAFSFALKAEIDAALLNKVRAALEGVIQVQDNKQRAFHLSGIALAIHDTIECLEYLQSFVKEVSKQVQQDERERLRLSTEMGNTQLASSAEKMYSAIEHILAHPTEVSGEV